MRRKQSRQQQTKKHYRKQRGRFLSRYNFAYAGRDTINQVGKIAPGLIKNASSEINNIAQHQINQAISQGGRESERVLPKIVRCAFEDVSQTPLGLLEKFGKQQLQKRKNRLLR